MSSHALFSLSTSLFLDLYSITAWRGSGELEQTLGLVRVAFSKPVHAARAKIGPPGPNHKIRTTDHIVENTICR